MSISQAVSTSLSPFIDVQPMIFRVQCKRKKMEIGKKDGNAVTGFGGSGGGVMKGPVWQCVKDCGACCKLAKGPSFATPEEIFDNPVDVQLYRSLIGPDGWCVHFEKTTRTCSIYAERPYFCRVERDIFQTLYGIDKKKFNKEACSFCNDTIKAIYGHRSKELETFNRAIRTEDSG